MYAILHRSVPLSLVLDQTEVKFGLNVSLLLGYKFICFLVNFFFYIYKGMTICCKTTKSSASLR